MSNDRNRILLGHLASNGDCLYVTTIARQIKTDYPGCHLTWAIGDKYAHVIKNNPYVDEIWIIAANEYRDYFTTSWQVLKKEALKRLKEGFYQKIFFTQIYYENFHNFDGLIRSSIFRSYPNPITVPVQPVIELTNEEVLNVKEFAHHHHVTNYEQVILFECTPQSGQSFITLELALEISKMVVENNKNTCVIITSNKAIPKTNPQIIDGSLLSFRENAELTKYCTLLVGCSSGITWLATSTWAKPLKTIQLLDNHSNLFASLRADHEAFNLPTDHIIEMGKSSSKKVTNCIDIAINNGFKKAKEQFDTRITNSFITFRGVQFHFFKLFDFSNGHRIYQLHVERFGKQDKLKLFYAYNVVKFMAFTPWLFLQKLILRLTPNKKIE